MFQGEAPNPLRTGGFGDYDHYFEWAKVADTVIEARRTRENFYQILQRYLGLDHGVGHSLLLLYDAKAPRGQKSKEFKGLGHYLSNTLYRVILYHNKIYYLYNYLIF